MGMVMSDSTSGPGILGNVRLSLVCDDRNFIDFLFVADRTAVTPPSVEPTLAVPGRQSPGLFGPRSPSTHSNSMYERR
jgi:hypothetical protein